MMNLYWKSAGQMRSLLEYPFGTEMEFEKYIFDNQDILGDIFIIYRQVRTGSRQGIPDMLGVDQNGRICLIELKNQEADESVLPQALGYAMWAETNPDSIKAIWLESKSKPEEIQLDWDNLDIRVVLIAPAFKATVPNMARKIGYLIDLFQVRRYRLDADEFLLVEQVEAPVRPKAVTTKATEVWDWEYYISEHGPEATAQFRKAVEALDAFVQRKGWDIQYNFNKYYTGFKLGSRVVFSVSWGGAYAWKLKLKVPRKSAQGFQGPHWEFQAYDNAFKEAILRPLHPDQPEIGELEDLLVDAYQTVSGRK